MRWYIREYDPGEFTIERGGKSTRYYPLDDAKRAYDKILKDRRYVKGSDTIYLMPIDGPNRLLRRGENV